MADIVERLMFACNGHPAAKIEWPHRVLHDAADEISALRTRAEAAEKRCAELEAALEEMRPHIEKIERCVRINDEMGRVVVGQTEAAREIARIFAALSSNGEGA